MSLICYLVEVRVRGGFNSFSAEDRVTVNLMLSMCAIFDIVFGAFFLFWVTGDW